MQDSDKQAQKNRYSFLTLPIAQHLCISLFLCITPAAYAMKRERAYCVGNNNMEQEEKEDGARGQLAPNLPSFTAWCRQAHFYSLNKEAEYLDPERADIEYTSYLLESAQKSCPGHCFENFTTYVGMRSAYGDGETEIDLERWTGKSTIELYKEFLEAQIAQENHSRAHHAKQIRAHIALKTIPGKETFELNLLNGDTWNSFQEKITRLTGIPAEFLSIKIGGSGDPSSFEDLIAWVNSGKCVLVIDSRKIPL